MSVRTVLTASVLVLFCAGQAAARNTEHSLPVEEAVSSALGAEKLLDVPFYFAGQEHPPQAKALGEWKTRKSTRGLFRSDSSACQIAFLSALITLQERAVREGGDAIVDIKSVTRSVATASATEYRCVAGSTVVHVALSGTVVTLQ